MNNWMNDPSRWQAKQDQPSREVTAATSVPAPQPKPLLQFIQSKENAAIANGSDAANAIFSRAGIIR